MHSSESKSVLCSYVTLFNVLMLLPVSATITTFNFLSWKLYRLLLLSFSIITLMIIANRALWLARSFALSRYNHCAVITALKASSFQNGSQFFWCFGVGNRSIILFSWIIINVIILKQLVASGDVNIGEYSRCLRRLSVKWSYKYCCNFLMMDKVNKSTIRPMKISAIYNKIS